MASELRGTLVLCCHFRSQTVLSLQGEELDGRHDESRRDGIVESVPGLCESYVGCTDDSMIKNWFGARTILAFLGRLQPNQDLALAIISPSLRTAYRPPESRS